MRTPTTLRPGRLGMVDAICFSAKIHDPDQIDDLATLSSAALAAYVWDPRLNPPQEPPLPFNPLGELFSNYGVFEAIAYATGLQVCEVNNLSAQDWRALVQFELDEDRPVLTLGLHGPLRPTLILSSANDRRLTTMTIQRAGADATETVTINRKESPQGTSEDFEHWMVFVREGERAEWAPSIGRLRIDMLRWFVRHSALAKEFFHETRANYAPGQSAITTMGRLLTDELPQLLGEDAPPRAELAAYLDDHLTQLRLGRATASRALVRWAAELDRHPDVACTDLDAARAALLDASAQWAATAALLDTLPPVHTVTLDTLHQLAHTWRLIAPCEQAAQQAVTRALLHLPPP
jgi:hypothetical protein